jgi:DNA primase
VDHVDILDVIESRVKLKKSGKNHSGLCPFHNEKSPSFSVNTQKQFYYCFGCGAGGNALNFVMEHDKLEFVEAIEELARLAGMEVPREEQSQQQQQKQASQKTYFSIMEQACDFFQLQLGQHDDKKIAISYLQNRGLTSDVAHRFQLGYAPKGWDNLKEGIANNEDTLTKMIELGLLVHNEEKKRIYDFFRERITFPIRDSRGRCIGFGGRILTSEKTAKYLNSPETPIFSKGKELYGLYEAKKFSQNLTQLLVVEGYMDVIALAQFGIDYAVAALGTATSDIHIQRMSKIVPNIIFCFDGDNAGRKAAIRACENALPLVNDQTSLKFIFLPDGEDPDSMVRGEGKEAFEQRLKKADHLSDFLFDYIGREHDLDSMDGKARFSKEILAKLDLMPDSILRKMMFDRVAQITGLNVELLKESMPDKPAYVAPVKKQITPPTPSYEQTPTPDYYESDDYYDAPQKDYPHSAPVPYQTQNKAPKNVSASAMTPARRATALLILQPTLAYEFEPLNWLGNSHRSDWLLLIQCWNSIRDAQIRIQHPTLAWELLGQLGLSSILERIQNSEFFLTNQNKDDVQRKQDFNNLLVTLAEQDPNNELALLIKKIRLNQFTVDEFKRYQTLLLEQKKLKQKKH